MKINKKNLTQSIEDIIAEGVVNGEEIDITTKKVMHLVWPTIEFLQYLNNLTERRLSYNNAELLTPIPDPNLDTKLLERFREIRANLSYPEISSEYEKGWNEALLELEQRFVPKPKTVTVTNDKGETKVISLEAWNNLPQSE